MGVVDTFGPEGISEAPLTSVFTSLQASEMFDIVFRAFSYVSGYVLF